MKTIQCTNCETYYKEYEINLIECLKCKTDKYLMEIMTRKEALNEYQSLLNDDNDFNKEYKNTNKDFYEWCSNYDDLKHITKGNKWN